jgi:hypothetical protein
LAGPDASEVGGGKAEGERGQKEQPGGHGTSISPGLRPGGLGGRARASTRRPGGHTSGVPVVVRRIFDP